MFLEQRPRPENTQKDAVKRDAIVNAIEAMAKEQLFIIEKAGIVGTRAGEVLQVIDVRKGTLNNVITFPPVIDPSQSTTLSTSLQTCTRLKTFSYKKETKALFSAFVCNSKNCRVERKQLGDPTATIWQGLSGQGHQRGLLSC
ncbi:hypothetical protein HID58_057533 [Brassica napus]|uniref:Uncharacterized protein n=1 Tax=Brassica napus TaxID=3708 RepID=A0ABQ8ARD0_BRANA|nr:hypothetical protein HID58_057533 [Brassica napus]